jgi:hypothetical protein
MVAVLELAVGVEGVEGVEGPDAVRDDDVHPPAAADTIAAKPATPTAIVWRRPIRRAVVSTRSRGSVRFVSVISRPPIVKNIGEVVAHRVGGMHVV